MVDSDLKRKIDMESTIYVNVVSIAQDTVIKLFLI